MHRKKLILYVAHALSYRKEVRNMTEKLEKYYYVQFLNPFYHQTRTEIEQLDALKTPDEKEQCKQSWSLDECKNIVKLDLDMIDESDGIIAFLTKGILGTACELQYAYTTNKKIYVITEIYCHHPWVRTYSDNIFINIDEFKIWLEKNGYKREYVKKD
jgi:nucleoside 2-deoxyribosyltransferase